MEAVLWLLISIFPTPSFAGLTKDKIPVDFSAWNTTRPYQVRMTKLLCVEQPYKHTEVHACSIKLQRGKPALMDFCFTFTKPLNAIHLVFTTNYKYTTYQPLLMQLEIELCEYFRKDWGKGTNKIADFLVNAASSQVTWIGQCPYYGPYNVTNFELRSNLLPQFLPAGDYRFDLRFHDADNGTLIYLQIFCNVRAKGIFDLSMG